MLNKNDMGILVGALGGMIPVTLTILWFRSALSTLRREDAERRQLEGLKPADAQKTLTLGS